MSERLPATKAAARVAGTKTYFTGIPCKRGHLSERRTSDGKCVPCDIEYQRAWWAERPGQKGEYWRAWNAENREHRNAYKRAKGWQPSKEARARWAKNNPEDARASYRHYYQKNKDLFIVKRRNRIARVKSAEGRHSAEDIRNILRAQKGKCGYCRVALGAKYHVDHIVALSAGGANDRTNLQLLCKLCNLSKGAKHPVEYARQIGLLL